MTHYAKGVDKQVVNTRTRNDCRHRPLHRYPGPPRSRQPHANGAGRPAYRRPGLPRSRRPCADGAGRPTCGRGWTAHMMEEQMGETDGAAAAWDAEYRAGPRAHPGGPGAGSRRRPVLRAALRAGDGYLARARGDGASPRRGPDRPLPSRAQTAPAYSLLQRRRAGGFVWFGFRASRAAPTATHLARYARARPVDPVGSHLAEDRRFELLRGCPQHAFQVCRPGFSLGRRVLPPGPEPPT